MSASQLDVTPLATCLDVTRVSIYELENDTYIKEDGKRSK